MPFGKPDYFTASPIEPTRIEPVRSWGNPWLAPAPKAIDDQSWKQDDAKKRLFGVEWAKNNHPFNAACVIFTDTVQALWASQNWISDPIVIASKDGYNSAVKTNLLDKDALLMKLLDLADEKDPTGRFHTIEAKDRLKALELYAKIQGFIDKIDINASTNNFTNNSMKIVFVKPDNQNDNKVIEVEPEEIQEQPKLPLNIKLVS